MSVVTRKKGLTQKELKARRNLVPPVFLGGLLEQLLRAETGLPVALECPECGDAGPHDVNGDKSDPTMLCEKCGAQTDVVPLYRSRTQ